ATLVARLDRLAIHLQQTGELVQHLLLVGDLSRDDADAADDAGLGQRPALAVEDAPALGLLAGPLDVAVTQPGEDQRRAPVHAVLALLAADRDLVLDRKSVVEGCRL